MSLLSLIVIIPLIGALVILAIPGKRTRLIQGVTLVTSAVCLFFTGYLYAAFDKAVVTMQFVEKYAWIPAFNINYYVGVDGLSVALITLRNLTLAFGGPPLFDGVNRQIEAGERLCLLGRNGTGKSTLLKVIAGELPADGGEIHRQQGLKVALVDLAGFLSLRRCAIPSVISTARPR